DAAQDEDLPRTSLGGNARADVNGHAGDLVHAHLALACVKPGAHLEPELTDCIADRAGAPNRPSRAVEACEEAVACCVEFAPAEPIKLATDHHVVRGEKLRPAVVAEVGRLSGRADDVREEDGTQHRFRLGLSPRTGEEALRLRWDR